MNLKKYALPLAIAGGCVATGQAILAIDEGIVINQALAETYLPVSIETLRANPGKYLGKKVEIKGIPYGVSAMRGERYYTIDFYIMSSIHKGAMHRRGVMVSTSGTMADYGSTIAALVDSEIRDGDQETITVRGNFINGRLLLNSITANGYTISKKVFKITK